MICDQGRIGGARFFGEGDIQWKGQVLTFGLAKRPPKFPPLVGRPDLLIWKTLMRVVGLLTVMILKRVSESILFQIKRFTA